MIAVGHIGASGGTITAPDPASELMEFAAALNGVDAVIGGHTHTQYITYLPNGVLVTENLNCRLPLHPHPAGGGHQHQGKWSTRPPISTSRGTSA